jgi:hypothetical protein
MDIANERWAKARPAGAYVRPLTDRFIGHQDTRRVEVPPTGGHGPGRMPSGSEKTAVVRDTLELINSGVLSFADIKSIPTFRICIQASKGQV